ncbi:sigma-70 family RNA polymerase sigma factor [Nakamurella flavida]|uniref:Sigma-70 family RNA polymerase sigma factor n=1 Tax=Nakamurella flavida TaxID=363630 RepID=A0A938YM47_9ACTN|nr:sigma-70 family RNA polymerase sigma factor [Nakamurella flavida]MBM9477228.1 sigma-70 family RNA polymerase sigma factor [Nakamurella flavida]MDP9780178.1 RNA polymerase sigma factor (sigma-70 family) [Nakamurella flavida]
MAEHTGDVTELVVAAAAGDARAWNDLVERYLPLVISVLRRYRMSDRDAEDVSQTVWLRLVEHLGSLREPRALPSWIVTTTKNEALRVLRARRLGIPVDPQTDAALERPTTDEVDQDLLTAERRQVVRDGLAELSATQRELLLLLVADPPIGYEEIGRRLGMPVGSIGPTRARCLRKLRETTALRSFLAPGTGRPAGPPGR